MPKYSLVNITCYCGRHYTNVSVGENVKCPCGVVLHTQQKCHVTGKVWGTAKSNKLSKHIYDLAQRGESKLCANFQ